MDPGSLLTAEEFEKLKCAICGNYLSHLPIHSSTSGENVCGRCPISPENHFKNEIYEISSKNISFPCRYQSEGCCEILIPKDIPQHEEQCLYKTSDCPTQELTACVMKVSQPNLIKHCQEEHSEYLLKDEKFEIDLKESREYGYLLERENEIIILKCEFEHQEKIFKLMSPRRGNFKLKFTCGSKSVSVKCDDIDQENIHKINLDWLINPDEPKLAAELYLERKGTATRKDFYQEISNLWKCSSCSNYDLQINFSYYNKMCSQCQRCFYASGGTLYMKIDRMGTLITFPCKNTTKGCNFTGERSKVVEHQEFCQFGSIMCPYYDSRCVWTGLRNNLETHLREHGLLASKTIFPFEKIIGTSRCVLKYSHYLFNVFCINQNQKIYWIVQMIGRFFKDMFKYEIQIYSGSNSIPKITLSQACLKQCNLSELNDLNTYCYIALDQIKSHFNEGKIKCKISILKI